MKKTKLSVLISLIILSAFSLLVLAENAPESEDRDKRPAPPTDNVLACGLRLFGRTTGRVGDALGLLGVAYHLNGEPGKARDAFQAEMEGIDRWQDGNQYKDKPREKILDAMLYVRSFDLAEKLSHHLFDNNRQKQFREKLEKARETGYSLDQWKHDALCSNCKEEDLLNVEDSRRLITFLAGGDTVGLFAMVKEFSPDFRSPCDGSVWGLIWRLPPDLLKNEDQRKPVFRTMLDLCPSGGEYVFQAGEVSFPYVCQGGSEGWLFIEMAENSARFEPDLEGFPLVDLAFAYSLAGGHDRKVLLAMLDAAGESQEYYRRYPDLLAVGVAYSLAGVKTGKEEQEILKKIVKTWK